MIAARGFRWDWHPRSFLLGGLTVKLFSEGSGVSYVSRFRALPRTAGSWWKAPVPGGPPVCFLPVSRGKAGKIIRAAGPRRNHFQILSHQQAERPACNQRKKLPGTG
jgi:hypothetical protein